MRNTYAEAYRIETPRQILDADRWSFMERASAHLVPVTNGQWTVMLLNSRALVTDAHNTPQAAIDAAIFEFRIL